MEGEWRQVTDRTSGRRIKQSYRWAGPVKGAHGNAEAITLRAEQVLSGHLQQSQKNPSAVRDRGGKGQQQDDARRGKRHLDILKGNAARRAAALAHVDFLRWQERGALRAKGGAPRLGLHTSQTGAPAGTSVRATNLAPAGQAGRVAVDNKAGEGLARLGVGVRLGQHKEPVGVLKVGDPHLAAYERKSRKGAGGGVRWCWT